MGKFYTLCTITLYTGRFGDRWLVSPSYIFVWIIKGFFGNIVMTTKISARRHFIRFLFLYCPNTLFTSNRVYTRWPVQSSFYNLGLDSHPIQITTLLEVHQYFMGHSKRFRWFLVGAMLSVQITRIRQLYTSGCRLSQVWTESWWWKKKRRCRVEKLEDDKFEKLFWFIQKRTPKGENVKYVGHSSSEDT